MLQKVWWSYDIDILIHSKYIQNFGLSWDFMQSLYFVLKTYHISLGNNRLHFADFIVGETPPLLKMCYFNEHYTRSTTYLKGICCGFQYLRVIISNAGQ